MWIGEYFFDTFVLSRFKINILMFSWYSATSVRWSSAGCLLDLLQVALLASGASLVGREAANRERRSRPAPTKDFFESLADCIRWVQSFNTEGTLLYLLMDIIPMFCHCLAFMMNHFTTIKHWIAQIHCHRGRAGGAWSKPLKTLVIRIQLSLYQRLINKLHQTTTSYSPLWSCTRWLSKCIVGLFWGSNLPPCWKFVPQNSPTMHLTTILTQSSAQPQSGQ